MRKRTRQQIRSTHIGRTAVRMRILHKLPGSSVDSVQGDWKHIVSWWRSGRKLDRGTASFLPQNSKTQRLRLRLPGRGFFPILPSPILFRKTRRNSGGEFRLWVPNCPCFCIFPAGKPHLLLRGHAETAEDAGQERRQRKIVPDRGGTALETEEVRDEEDRQSEPAMS